MGPVECNSLCERKSNTSSLFSCSILSLNCCGANSLLAEAFALDSFSFVLVLDVHEIIPEIKQIIAISLKTDLFIG